MRRSLVLFLAVATPLLMAQNPGASTSGATGPATSRPNPTTNPGAIPGAQSPTTPVPGDPNRDSIAPDYYYGKLAMADGSPLPNGIPIVRACLGGQKTIALTDSKGQFTYQTGSLSDSMTLGDASDGSGGSAPVSRDSRLTTQNALRVADMSCEIRADLPGYRSDVVTLDRLRGFGNSDLGTIVLRRLANVEGTSVSATLFAAPGDARKAYDRGLQSLHKGRLPDARKDLDKAVALYPKFANAWLALGRVELRQNQNEPARDAFLKALDADSKLVEAQVELGIMAAREKNWHDAAQYLDSALKLDPVDFPQIWFTDAVANFNSRNYDQAEKMAREALKVDAAHKNPQVNQLLGMALAQKHDYAAAAEELRTYLKLAPTATDYSAVKAQLDLIEGQLVKNPQ